jgi:hypothetical protein
MAGRMGRSIISRIAGGVMENNRGPPELMQNSECKIKMLQIRRRINYMSWQDTAKARYMKRPGETNITHTTATYSV